MTDLTIIMPCYNKEEYIEESLQSIFAQKTRFSFKIIVADDNSSDKTLDIVDKYAMRYPGTITVLKSNVNQKLFKNVIRAYAMLDTPYFCVLDPDDYWTSDLHIENALSFLSTHEDYTIYSSGFQCLKHDASIEQCIFSSIPVTSDFNDYVNGRAVIAFTLTCVYRNVVFLKGIPPRVLELESKTKEKTFRGDSFRTFLHIRAGLAYFSPGVEACYRLTDSGVFQGMGAVGQHLLNAELYADFWRYDFGKHVEFLFQSYNLFRNAKKEFLSLMSQGALPNFDLAKIGMALYELELLYMQEHEKMHSYCFNRFSLKRRVIYRLLAKRLEKDYRRFGAALFSS